MREKRFKILLITEECILDLFQAARMTDGKLRLPTFQTLPRDIEFVGVQYSFDQGAFMVKIRHDSFDVVPHGRRIDVISEELSYETVEIKEKDTK